MFAQETPETVSLMSFSGAPVPPAPTTTATTSVGPTIPGPTPYSHAPPAYAAFTGGAAAPHTPNVVVTASPAHTTVVTAVATPISSINPILTSTPLTVPLHATSSPSVDAGGGAMETSNHEFSGSDYF